jgi:hypothetical protein
MYYYLSFVIGLVNFKSIRIMVIYLSSSCTHVDKSNIVLKNELKYCV